MSHDEYSGPGTPQREPTLEEYCEKYRGDIRDIGKEIWRLKGNWFFHGEQAHTDQHSEMQDNLMLAYRHLEDARMRLGKVMQQIQGGVSIFDRPGAREAVEKLKAE